MLFQRLPVYCSIYPNIVVSVYVLRHHHDQIILSWKKKKGISEKAKFATKCKVRISEIVSKGGICTLNFPKTEEN